MIRIFQLSQDNVPVSTTISEEASALGYISVETGTPVSWAIIVQSNVSLTNNTPDRGPYYTPTPGSGNPYSIRSFTDVAVDATYVSKSLKVYYNGQLLTRDVEYTEDSSYEFSFIIGGSGLPEAPDSIDTIAISYRISEAGGTVGSKTVRVDKDSFYPNQATGFKILYENFSLGDPINLEIIYR